MTVSLSVWQFTRIIISRCVCSCISIYRCIRIYKQTGRVSQKTHQTTPSYSHQISLITQPNELRPPGSPQRRGNPKHSSNPLRALKCLELPFVCLFASSAVFFTSSSSSSSFSIPSMARYPDVANWLLVLTLAWAPIHSLGLVIQPYEHRLDNEQLVLGQHRPGETALSILRSLLCVTSIALLSTNLRLTNNHRITLHSLPIPSSLRTALSQQARKPSVRLHCSR